MSLPARRVPDNVGRPRFKITLTILKRLYKLAEEGMPKRWAAKRLGIHPDTFISKEKESPIFSAVWEAGTAKGLNAVFKGLKTNATEMAIGPNGKKVGTPGGSVAAQVAYIDRIVGKPGTDESNGDSQVDRIIFERRYPKQEN